MTFTFLDFLEIDCNKYHIIPKEFMPTKIYDISFEGWQFMVIVDNIEFHNSLHFVKKTIDSFVEIYKDTHAFSQPIFTIKANGTICLKMGTREI